MRNRSNIFIYWLMFGSFLVSCNESLFKNEMPETNDIDISASIDEGEKSRTYWEENSQGKYDTSLAFNWDTDLSGSMKTVLIGKDSFKPFPNEIYASTNITKTEQRKHASLKIDSEATNYYEEGDLLVSYYPVVAPHGKISRNGQKLTLDYCLPNVVNDAKLNSTEHLRPYILMSGQGRVVNSEAHLKCKVLPSIIRFHLINRDKQNFTLNKVSLSGRLSTKATISLSEKGEENVVYPYWENNQTAVENEIKFQPSEGGNLYTLLFPITFNEGEKLIFNLEGTYDDGWSAIYKDIAIECSQFFKGSVLESNTYYWVGVEVYRDQIRIELNNHTIQVYNKAHNEDLEIGPE